MSKHSTAEQIVATVEASEKSLNAQIAELVAVKAQISKLDGVKDGLTANVKGEMISLSTTRYESINGRGQVVHTATLVEQNRTTLDAEAVKLLLTPAQYAACCKVTPILALRVK